MRNYFFPIIATIFAFAVVIHPAPAMDVQLRWTHPEPENVQFYKIQAISRSANRVDIVDGSLTETVSTGHPDETVTFSVAANNGTVDSPYSNTISVTPDNTLVLHDYDAVLVNAALDVDGLRPTDTGTYFNSAGPEVAYWNINMTGSYKVWGRFYYEGEDNDANSFYFCVDNYCLPFGNNLGTWYTWHWDGNGFNETAGSQEPINVTLSGNHKISLRTRETQPSPPKLSHLVITDAIGVPELSNPPTTTTTTTSTSTTTTSTSTTTTAAPTTTTSTTTTSTTTSTTVSSTTSTSTTTTTTSTTTTTLPDLNDCLIYDTNGDGKITWKDATDIMQGALKLHKCKRNNQGG